MLAAHLQGCASHAENIDGHACWRVPTELSLDADQWYAVIDDRFLLAAEQKSTLALALAATGDLPSVLAPFGDLAFLSDDADGVILSLPRPGEDAKRAQLTPSAPMVFVSLQDPWRLAVYSKAALSVYYRDLLGRVWGHRDPDVTDVGGWMCQQGETVEPVSRPDQLAYIAWRMFFGTRLVL